MQNDDFYNIDSYIEDMCRLLPTNSNVLQYVKSNKKNMTLSQIKQIHSLVSFSVSCKKIKCLK